MPTKPALTPEEWARFPDIAQGGLEDGPRPVYHHTMHGIAAANLHDQEFGFTREDVRLLRLGVNPSFRDGEDFGRTARIRKKVNSLADRIQALLRPAKGLLADEDDS